MYDSVDLPKNLRLNMPKHAFFRGETSILPTRETQFSKYQNDLISYAVSRKITIKLSAITCGLI